MAGRNPVLVVAVLLDVVAVGCVLTPWWRSPVAAVLLSPGGLPVLPVEPWAGWEVLGWPAVATLGALVLLAVGGLVAGWRWTAVAAGAAAAGAAGCAAVGWGVPATAGAWSTALLGAAGAGLALLAGPRAGAPGQIGADAGTGAAGGDRAGTGVAGGDRRHRARSWAGTGVAVLVGAGVVALGLPALRPAVAAGPYVRLAPLVAGPLRSGTAGLPVDAGARLAVAAGGVVLVSPDGVVRLSGAGRAEVLARSPDERSAGPVVVSGDRVVLRDGPGTVAIGALVPGAEPGDVVRGVGGVSPDAPDGVVWLRSDADPPGTLRVLDLAGRRIGVQEIPAVYLPVVGVGADPALDPGALLPRRDGTAVRVGAAGLEVVRVEDNRITVTPQDCPTDLDGATALTTAADGGVWLATGDQLLHAAPDGAPRAVSAPLPGPVTSLATAPDGTLVLLVGGEQPGLWALADPLAATTPARCDPDAPR